MADLPDGDRLSHGDFHLILMDGDEPVIIDWSNVRAETRRLTWRVRSAWRGRRPARRSLSA
jgi:hypothetical protein